MTQVFHALGFFYVYLLEKWNTKMSDKKLLREYYELCPNGICKDYLTESDKRRIREEGVVYLTGVIQRADAKNGNGRIYPRKVLEREVEKYKQIINENRALGELDHPECVSSGEVLTVEGWKEFVDLKEGEEIFTLSLSGDLEVQKITKRIEKSYKGKMIRIKGRNIDCEVTPNHRFLIVNRKNEYKYVTAKEILEDSIPDMNKCYIPKAIKNKKIEQNKTIKIKGIYLDKRHLVVEEFDYDGMVYCVNVPNSNFYLKQNGKVHWSGNSNTISLSNVSHIVESVWWDGNDLMGKIRVLKYHPKGKILEGLIKDGVQIGISSRAIGSIREEGDAIIVEDDLSLVGFDMVQCPSTHNAFMIKEYKEHKPRKKTKIDKLSYHLIDILK